MATASASVPLHSDPSNLNERKRQHLEPKSYVDAVQEAPSHTVNGATNALQNEDGVNGRHGIGGELHDNYINGSSNKANHHAPVLRITDTHGEGESTKGPTDKETGKEDKHKLAANGESKSHTSDGTEPLDQSGRPGIERVESQHEYSATGLDETPKASPRHRHRKTPSQKASTDAAPNAEMTTTFEKYEVHSNGNQLTTIKSSETYKKSQALSNEERKVDTEQRTLVSGRQAGKRWQTSGIRFAPMNVPLQRRLQTLMVLFHSTCIALAVSTFFFLCAIPIFWPLLIIYMIYCMTSNAATTGLLKRRSNLFRASPLWSLFASYFPARLHRSEVLPPTRKYIFGYHPHGIISHGAFAAFGTEALGFSQLFPGITNTLLTLDSNFRIPIYRDYALAMGLASVSRESCENLLSNGGPNGEGMGRAITIVVGGARESLDAQPYYMRLVLKRRKGFIKMALRTGADLVPVLGFGENDLYDQVTSTSHPTIHKAQLLAKRILGFTIPLFHARGVFNYDVGLMPYRRPLNIVVGRAIKVTKSVKPSQEEIDQLHDEYVRELKSIWELWKDDFAKDRKGELEIDE